MYTLCGCLWGRGRFAHVNETDCQVQKRALDPVELDLQVDVSFPEWLLGTVLWSLQEQDTLLTAETPLQPLAITVVWDRQDV